MPRVVQVPVPDGSLCARSLPHVDYSDAFAIELPPEHRPSVDRAVDAAFRSFPRWIAALMAVRDGIVRPFGLRTSADTKREPGRPYAKGDAVGIFRVFDRSDDEIVFGQDDRHLDFRAAFGVGSSLTLATVVRFHNRLGRAYFFPVAPAHRVIVRSMLRSTLAQLLRD